MRRRDFLKLAATLPFADGFETGDTSRWSRVVGEQKMAMRFGLSMYGATGLTNTQITQAILRSQECGITVWKIWMNRFPTWELGVVGQSGFVRQLNVEKFLYLVEQAEQAGITCLLTYNPALSDGNPGYWQQLPESHAEILALTASRTNIAWDLWNERDNKALGGSSQNSLQYLEAMISTTRSLAPGHEVSYSNSLRDPFSPDPWYLAQPRAIAESFFRDRFGGFPGEGLTPVGDIDFYCGHPERRVDLNIRNDDWFAYFGNRLAAKALPNAGRYWDDEGHREGYGEFFYLEGLPFEERVQWRVDAATGAKLAGCEVHIFHSRAIFNPTTSPQTPFFNLFSESERTAITRICAEVIDPTEPPQPPPPPPPPPTPEPC